MSNGYGFYINLSEKQLKQLIDFFEKHTAGKELFMYDERCENIWDEFYDRISIIMRVETGIDFAYIPLKGKTKDKYTCRLNSLPIGPDGGVIVFPCKRYPWSYNKQEFSLSENKLCEICKNYMNELGIEAEPGFIRIEYFG